MFLVAGIILAALIGEYAVRLLAPQQTGPVQFAYDTELGAIPVPGQQARRTLPGIYSYTYSNDDGGLRLMPFKEFIPGTDTVLVLGDSFTYGIGVNNDETYSAYLQERMKSVRFINAGNGGKGTDYALKYVQTRTTGVFPRIILLGFFSNDFSDNAREEYFKIYSDGKIVAKDLSSSLAANKSGLIRLPMYNWIISWSHAANLIKQAAIKIVTMRTANSPENNGVVDGTIPIKEGVGLERSEMLTRCYLNELNMIAKEKGSLLLAFYIPAKEELTAKSSSVQEMTFLKITQDLGVPSFSMLAALKKASLPPLQLYLQEGHWTPLSHSVAADVLIPCINSMLRLPDKLGESCIMQ